MFFAGKGTTRFAAIATGRAWRQRLGRSRKPPVGVALNAVPGTAPASGAANGAPAVGPLTGAREPNCLAPIVSPRERSRLTTVMPSSQERSGTGSAFHPLL